MIQPFPLGTSVTRVDGGNIATGTINAASAIIQGSITADRLDAANIQTNSILITSIINGINGGAGSSTKIDGGYIQTGTIAANRLVIQGGYSACINIDPQFQDPSVWTYCDGGSASLVTISDAPNGNRVLRSGTTFQGGDANYYPIDINKTYRVRFWARGIGHNGILYACLRQYTNNTGTTCSGNGGRSPYKPSATSVGGGWTEYNYTWGPADWQSGVKFVRLDWLLNYGGSAGYMEVCNPRFEEAITGSLVVDGTIAANHIVTAGLTADIIKTGQLAAARLDIDEVISVVNGTSTTKITGTGISTGTLTTGHIVTAGLDASIIKTGSITSQGNGAYQSYNYSNNTSVGFKLCHDTFSATNVYNRTQTGVQAEFGSTVMVKGYPLGPALGVPLTCIDFPPLDQAWTSATRVFYRGNNDLSTKGGAPDINCFSIMDLGCADWTNGFYGIRFRWRLKPTAASSNLDAMRYARIIVYGTTGTTPIDTFYAPLVDRIYANATDSDASNEVYGDFTWSHRGTAIPWNGASPYLFQGHLKITVYNAYGPSDERWYHANSQTTTPGYYPMDNTPPSGGTGGTGGGGTGGGGGGCVPAGTPFLTPFGWIPVEAVVEGGYARGYDHGTLLPVDSKISKVYRHEDRQLYRIITDRGELVCSHDHRLTRKHMRGEFTYPPARNLTVHDYILWRDPVTGALDTAAILEVTPLDRYETVYHITMEEGHVYVAGNFPAHNAHKILNQLT